MRFVSFPAPNSGVVSNMSVLGMGCSSLMGRAGKRESLRALAKASDAGINFFDTARSYGYGASESLLGEFLGQRRSEAIICTKFGILPPSRISFKQRLKPLAQIAVRMVPPLRSLARAAAGNSLVPGNFSVEVLHASLHTSLRELRTDYVDMLLLHWAPVSILQNFDLLGALGRLVEQGKVRLAGISGSQETIDKTFTERPAVLKTAQFSVHQISPLTVQVCRAVAAEGMFLVGNHPFGGLNGMAATRRHLTELMHDPALPQELRAKLQDSETDPQLIPEIVLNGALNGKGISSIVTSMMRPASLASNVGALSRCRFSRTELATLQDALG